MNHYDVAVCGGGFAGISAVLREGKNGANRAWFFTKTSLDKTRR